MKVSAGAAFTIESLISADLPAVALSATATDLADLHRRLGEAGEGKMALDLVFAAAGNAREHRDLIVTTARHLVRTRRREEACRLLLAAIENSPSDPVLVAQAGRLATPETPHVLSAVLDALRAAPDSLVIRESAVRASMASGRHDLAIDEVTELRTIARRRPMTALLVADVVAASGDPASALRELDIAEIAAAGNAEHLEEIERRRRSWEQETKDRAEKPSEHLPKASPRRSVDGILEKLTVVIPTYEKPQVLRRALNYWSGRGVAVLVLDGSRSGIPWYRRLRLGRRIRYVHMPISLHERLAVAGTMVKTPYTVLSGDDEFHLPSGLAAAIRLLEANGNLVACMGRAVAFSTDEAGCVLGSEAYAGFAEHRVDAETPRERMIQHMADYWPTQIYSVTRTPVWRAAMDVASRVEVPFYASGELKFELAVAHFGCSRSVPVLQWLRSREKATTTRSNDASLQRVNRLHEIWARPEFSGLVSQFVDTTAESLADVAGVSVAELREDISAAAGAYVKSCEGRAGGGSRPRAVRSRNPRKVQAPYQIAGLLKSAVDLETQGVEVDFDDVREAAEAIFAFANDEPEKRTVWERLIARVSSMTRAWP